MAAPRATMSRRRPLHTCASSVLGIINTAYKRSQQLDGPLGNFTKRLTTLATSAIPYASTMQHLGLTVLSLTDDHILFFERITESVFPPSGRVFDKIDTLVYSAEGLPRWFDEALNNIPSMMHQIPFLDWVLMHVIWWLNFLVSSLTHWGSRHAKEKEIMIDKSFDPCNSPIESPKKTDSSGEAQKRSVLSSVELIESPVKADYAKFTDSTYTKNLDEARGQSMVSSNESVESTDKEICDEARGQSTVGSNEFVESTDKEDEARGESMVGSNEFVESADKENFDEARGQSMVASNECVESVDKENSDEALGQSVVDSNEFVESTDKENVDEARGQSMVVGSNEFVESADKENLDEARDQSMVGGNEFVESPNSVETQEKSMLSDSEEPSSLMYHDPEEKSAEKKSKTEESEKKAEDDQEHPQHEDDQTDTNETNTLSPAESFQSAQFEHIVSPSATTDSFHEAKSFENIELPTTDEDETKEKSLPPVSSVTTATSSSGKSKAKGKKGTGKDEKKDENKVEDQHKILELLEAKWHMM